MVVVALLFSLSWPALVEAPRPPGPVVDTVAAGALWAHLSGPGCRIVPAYRRGRIVGIKLFGIRPGSPLAVDGFENGDILVAADGVPLTTAAAVWSLSSSTGPTTVTIERRGVQIR